MKRTINKITNLSSRKLLNVTVLVVQLPLALPIVIFIRLIAPIFHIRMGTIRSDRIGHFTIDSAIQLAESEQNNNKYIDWYWLDRPTCNQQWERMVCRTFYVRSWVKSLDIVNRFVLPGGDKHVRLSSDSRSRDINGVIAKSRSSFVFLNEENELAHAWLNKHGLDPAAPFVCLFVRDRAYLENHKLHKGKKWNYHDYRDSDIEMYSEAVVALLDKGYQVIRMGKIMEKELLIGDPNFLDYSFCEDQSDFLDIWLMANCRFCISTSSGLDSVCEAFRVPMLLVNYVPYSDTRTYLYAVYAYKVMVHESDGEVLGLSEGLSHSYDASDKYVSSGLLLRELRSNEIMGMALEMHHRLNGTWDESDNDIRMQSEAWRQLKSWVYFNEYNSWIHPKAKFSTVFLRHYPDFIR